MKGKLIVFEGTDGAGKTTQTRLMAQRLTREGAAFRVIDFPRYGNPFAEPRRYSRSKSHVRNDSRSPSGSLDAWWTALEVV